MPATELAVTARARSDYGGRASRRGSVRAARDDHDAAGIIGNSAGARQNFQQRGGADHLIDHRPLHRSDHRNRLAVLLFHEDGNLRMSDQAIFDQQLFHFLFELKWR